MKLPLYVSPVKAGFPSPAEDFIDKKLDLNEHLIKHPAATFFVKVSGDSMLNAGILSGDILIVDRSLEPTNGKIIVAILNGEFTVKYFKKLSGKVVLSAANPKYPDIQITADMDFQIWGVVTNAIHKL
ncbi:MAG: translesion error-prone DNA polymerase V autoproteolytic subunit [Candidatus Omnitrophica bacterium]|nr:translesion error-prone DNA polymerase V autoproteolytic subunit [Candidatus Omnitrophota bacterium]